MWNTHFDPELVVQASLHREHALRAVILEEASLFLVGLLEEGHRGGEAPGLVVGLLVEVQPVERLVRIDRERIRCEDRSLLRDGLVPALADLVELGQDLVNELVTGLEWQPPS